MRLVSEAYVFLRLESSPILLHRENWACIYMDRLDSCRFPYHSLNRKVCFINIRRLIYGRFFLS